MVQRKSTPWFSFKNNSNPMYTGGFCMDIIIKLYLVTMSFVLVWGILIAIIRAIL